MYALLLAAVLGGQDPTTRPATGAGDRGRDAAGPVTLDGSWAVVAYERDGSAVDGASSRTVTVRGNTMSFGTGRSGTGAGPDAGGGADAAFGTFRMEFGPRGTIRVTELGPGAAGGTGTGGTGTGKGAGTGRTETGAGTAAGADTGIRTGVYVMSRDFIAITLHEDRGGPGTGTGTSRPLTGPVTGTGTKTGTGSTGTGAGTGAGAAAGVGPEMRAYMTLILRRSDAGGTGTGGGAERK